MTSEASSVAENKSQPTQMARKFETADDHVTAYVDFVNMVSTGNEVILSAYETTPGFPSEGQGHVTSSRKATIFLSFAHALEIGTLLVKHGTRGLEKLRTDVADESE